MSELPDSDDGRLSCPTCMAIYRTGFDTCPSDQTKLVVASVDLLLGTIIEGKYFIDKCVGEGAMGRVYLAHHVRLTKRRFAIKILLGDLAADATMRRRFGLEAEAASRLQHPNVVSVLDFGHTEGGLHYLVMDFIEGGSLCDLIDEGPLSESMAIQISKQICMGLTHAHEEGLVHRDFKPDNVALVEHDGKTIPKVLDFGLAIISTAEECSVRLTSAGLVVGTPAYISPEQSQGKPVDQRTDLFAFGVSLYEMLSGALPFDGTIIDILYKNATTPPPPIEERTGIRVKKELEAVVTRLMNIDLDKRFPNAREVLIALEAIESPATMVLRGPRGKRAHTVEERQEIEAARTMISVDSAEPVAIPEASGHEDSDGAKNASLGAAANTTAKTIRSPGRPVAKLALLLAGIGAAAGLSFLLLRSPGEQGHAAGHAAGSSAVEASRASTQPSQQPLRAVNSAEALLQTAQTADSSKRRFAGVTAPTSGDSGSTVDAISDKPAEKVPAARPTTLPSAPASGSRGNNKKTTLPKKKVDRDRRNLGRHGKEGPGRRASQKFPAPTVSPPPAGETVNVSPGKGSTARTESKPSPITPPTTTATTSPTKPVTVEIKPPAPTKPARPAPTPPPAPRPRQPTAFKVVSTIASFSAEGPLSDSKVKQGLLRVVSNLEGCYESAARAAKANARIAVKVRFVISVEGRVHEVSVGNTPFKNLSRCIASAFKKLKTREHPDTGPQRVELTLRFKPKQ